MGLLALHDGDPTRTVLLMSSAKALRASASAEATRDQQAEVANGLATARSMLTRRDADAAWDRGAELTLQEAVQYATGAAPAALGMNGSPLTGRETQVATLIADGLTNIEIAERLRIAHRTADAHVEHIRNKLGLRTRSQIAVWASKRLGTG
jgi:non-specific serine/threonine protein kinase